MSGRPRCVASWLVWLPFALLVPHRLVLALYRLAGFDNPLQSSACAFGDLATSAATLAGLRAPTTTHRLPTCPRQGIALAFLPALLLSRPSSGF